MKQKKSYDNERLACLLGLLRPAPVEWVAKAQRIPVELTVSGQPVLEETPLTAGDLAELGRKLETDPMFRRRFDADPVAAAEAAGMHELGLHLRHELHELVALAGRIARDDAYRVELAADPLAALAAAGIPAAATTEPLLRALAVSEEMVAKLPEVVAHQHEQLSLRARLLILLLRSTAVGDQIRSATGA
jgi:hypothetical protein